MKRKQFATTFAVFAAALAAEGFAQGNKTFTVQEGSSPWYDRVGLWKLEAVPDSLKSDIPVPQQFCAGHSVDVLGSPKMVLIGVDDRDLASIRAAFPQAKLTGEIFSMRYKNDHSLAYTVLQLENPPAKITTPGVISGVILLKVIPR